MYRYGIDWLTFQGKGSACLLARGRQHDLGPKDSHSKLGSAALRLPGRLAQEESWQGQRKH